MERRKTRWDWRTPGRVELLLWACDIADQFKPLAEEERILLEKLSTGLKPIFPP